VKIKKEKKIDGLLATLTSLAMLYNACKAYDKSGQLARASEKKRGNPFFPLKGERWKRREGLDTKKQKSNKIGALMQPMPPR
jgi:hypothetical protein